MYHGTSKSYHGLLQVYGFVPFGQFYVFPPAPLPGIYKTAFRVRDMHIMLFKLLFLNSHDCCPLFSRHQPIILNEKWIELWKTINNSSTVIFVTEGVRP